LVVEARREQMSYAVHRLNGLYAQGFNHRHERRGHLFENRFASWVVEDEQHLSATITYVLENPVHAGLCREAREGWWGWPRAAPQFDLAQAAVADRAASEGLSLGRG